MSNLLFTFCLSKSRIYALWTWITMFRELRVTCAIFGLKFASVLCFYAFPSLRERWKEQENKRTWAVEHCGRHHQAWGWLHTWADVHHVSQQIAGEIFETFFPISPQTWSPALVMLSTCSGSLSSRLDWYASCILLLPKVHLKPSSHVISHANPQPSCISETTPQKQLKSMTSAGFKVYILERTF